MCNCFLYVRSGSFLHSIDSNLFGIQVILYFFNSYAPSNAPLHNHNHPLPPNYLPPLPIFPISPLPSSSFHSFCLPQSADLLLTSGTALPKSQAEAKFKAEKVQVFVQTLRKALHNTFR